MRHLHRSDSREILLFGSNDSAGLEICRSLGQAGHRVAILRLSLQRTAADHSRFCEAPGHYKSGNTSWHFAQKDLRSHKCVNKNLMRSIVHVVAKRKHAVLVAHHDRVLPLFTTCWTRSQSDHFFPTYEELPRLLGKFQDRTTSSHDDVQHSQFPARIATIPSILPRSAYRTDAR